LSHRIKRLTTFYNGHVPLMLSLFVIANTTNGCIKYPMSTFNFGYSTVFNEIITNSNLRCIPLFVLFFGENPQVAAYSAHPLCWSGWGTSYPTTHRGAVWKDGAEIPWVLHPQGVFNILRGSLTSPFIFNNSVKMAALFNMVNHPRCCEPRN